MRLIDKLVFKDLLGPFINGLAMFMLLIFAASVLFPVTELLVQGLAFPVVAKLVVYSLPGVVTQTFPMAMLLAGLMAFGRLSGDREAVAIFAAGISFPRAARVVWVMGATVSVLAFVWNDVVVPPATSAFLDLKMEAIKHIRDSDKPLAYTVEAPDGTGVEQFVSVKGGFDARTRTLRRVSIVKYSTDPKRRGEPEAIIYCASAHAEDQKGLKWKYYDGYFTVLTPDKSSEKISDFITQYFEELETLPREATVGKSFEEVLSSANNDPNRKSFRELRKEIQADIEEGRDTRGKEVDLYGKIALPLASLIFGVVGAALGLNTQRGGGKTVGFGVAIFIVFLYWVFYHSMFVVGKNGGLPPMLASFLADIVGAVVGVVLAARASR